MKKYIKPKKFAWVDLEMTGLDPKKSKIIEVAVIITDVDFNELASFEAIIKQPKRVLDAADEWVQQNMAQLLDASTEVGVDESEVLEDIEDLLNQHFEEDEKIVLAGNSIHQDRRFIRKLWPTIEDRLHYRMLDVSAWKVYMMAKFEFEIKKPNQHRALEDIRGSIAELQGYLQYFEGQK